MLVHLFTSPTQRPIFAGTGPDASERLHHVGIAAQLERQPALCDKYKVQGDARQASGYHPGRVAIQIPDMEPQDAAQALARVFLGRRYTMSEHCGVAEDLREGADVHTPVDSAVLDALYQAGNARTPLFHMMQSGMIPARALRSAEAVANRLAMIAQHEAKCGDWLVPGLTEKAYNDYLSGVLGVWGLASGLFNRAALLGEIEQKLMSTPSAAIQQLVAAKARETASQLLQYTTEEQALITLALIRHYTPTGMVNMSLNDRMIELAGLSKAPQNDTEFLKLLLIVLCHTDHNLFDQYQLMLRGNVKSCPPEQVRAIDLTDLRSAQRPWLTTLEHHLQRLCEAIERWKNNELDKVFRASAAA